ncbi:class I SAM-dependent methyltransferase [Pseudoroseicyclus sp. CXY001]|uniref:class I SAM-dependent methyltransferase n=1 Tax=Pseudoroseicyclus sp. CXY001 TaxID=3242492 RepID=UPI003570E435
MPHPPQATDGRAAAVAYGGLTYEDFRHRARDETLSETEKIGSPDALRAGYTAAILKDLVAKLPALLREGATLVDIGAGCGALTRALIAGAATRAQRYLAVDSAEMLALLPDAAGLARIPGRFPEESLAPLKEALPERGADVVLAYGVLQTVYLDGNPFAFLDAAASLLAPGGALLIGDVANHSQLRRFLASEAGRAYHRAYMRTEAPPDLPPFAVDPGRLDDAVLIGLLSRARASGFDAWLLPQPAALPVSNRREDLLVVRP